MNAVIQFPVRHHANADTCPCCGRLTRLLLFSRCQECVSLGRCPELGPGSLAISPAPVGSDKGEQAGPSDRTGE